MGTQNVYFVLCSWQDKNIFFISLLSSKTYYLSYSILQTGCVCKKFIWWYSWLYVSKVEHIIREDYLVEAMEMLELFCDLLLARFGLIETQQWVQNASYYTH